MKMNKKQKRNLTIVGFIFLIVIIGFLNLKTFSLIGMDKILVNTPQLSLVQDMPKYTEYSMTWTGGWEDNSCGEYESADVDIEVSNFQRPGQPTQSFPISPQELQASKYFPATLITNSPSITIFPCSGIAKSGKELRELTTECYFKYAIEGAVIDCNVKGNFKALDENGNVVPAHFDNVFTSNTINVKIPKEGIECLDNSYCGDNICQDNICIDKPINVYRLQDNQCSPVTIFSSDRITNDYDSLSECQTKIETPKTFYRFIENECSIISILPSIKTNLDFDSLEECELNREKAPIGIYFGIVGLIVLIGLLIWVYRRIK